MTHTPRPARRQYLTNISRYAPRSESHPPFPLLASEHNQCIPIPYYISPLSTAAASSNLTLRTLASNSPSPEPSCCNPATTLRKFSTNPNKTAVSFSPNPFPSGSSSPLTTTFAGSCGYACRFCGAAPLLRGDSGGLARVGPAVLCLVFERQPPLFACLGKPTPESARSELVLLCLAAAVMATTPEPGPRLIAVLGREADGGREFEVGLAGAVLSEGGIGQSSALGWRERSKGERRPSSAVANVANVLTESSERVRRCTRLRSISFRRSGVSGVGGG